VATKVSFILASRLPKLWFQTEKVWILGLQTQFHPGYCGNRGFLDSLTRFRFQMVLHTTLLRGKPHCKVRKQCMAPGLAKARSIGWVGLLRGRLKGCSGHFRWDGLSTTIPDPIPSSHRNNYPHCDEIGGSRNGMRNVPALKFSLEPWFQPLPYT